MPSFLLCYLLVLLLIFERSPHPPHKWTRNMKKIWQKWKDTQLTLRQHIKSTLRTARQRHGGHALIQHQQLVLETGRNRKTKPVVKLELEQKQTQKEQRWWNYRTRVSNHLLQYAQGFKEQHKHNRTETEGLKNNQVGLSEPETPPLKETFIWWFKQQILHLWLFGSIPCPAMREWPVPTCFRAGGIMWA